MKSAATQGYWWSNLWNLEEISIIAEDLGLDLGNLSLLETWWRPVPLGLEWRYEVEGRSAYVDLGYQAEIDGQLATVWSENFGETIHAQWGQPASFDAQRG